MSFFVQKRDGETIEVPEIEIIRTMELWVQDTEGIPIDQQRLTFGGQQLEDAGTLRSYNIYIKNKPTLQLVVLPPLKILVVCFDDQGGRAEYSVCLLAVNAQSDIGLEVLKGKLFEKVGQMYDAGRAMMKRRRRTAGEPTSQTLT